MNKDANNEYLKADVKLNEVYQKILKDNRSDSVFIYQFKRTQKIWISYRDAELEMKFPAKKKQLEYGSVYPMCVSFFLKELTQERAEKLKVWLHGVSEGDVCSSSVKKN
ncbi:MAG: hypothetical protein ACJARZ_002116 [Dokdonia sp.]|jgi:uncharacterized protein YecT (DUF1311 family)